MNDLIYASADVCALQYKKNSVKIDDFCVNLKSHQSIVDTRNIITASFT